MRQWGKNGRVGGVQVVKSGKTSAFSLFLLLCKREPGLGALALLAWLYHFTISPCNPCPTAATNLVGVMVFASGAEQAAVTDR